jgi:hypothetical protein
MTGNNIEGVGNLTVVGQRGVAITNGNLLVGGTQGDQNNVVEITQPATRAVAIGTNGPNAQNDGIALGHGAGAGPSGVSIGRGASTGGGQAPTNAIAIGRQSAVDANSDYSIAIGNGALVSSDTTGAMALGTGAKASRSNQATFGNLGDDRLSVNITGNLTVHGSYVDVQGAEIRNVVSNSPGDAVNRSFVLNNNVDNQTLSVDNSSTNATLSISNGNSVTIWDRYVDADADSSNEIQSIQVSGDRLTLSSDGTLVFAPYANNSDTLDGFESDYFVQGLSAVLSNGSTVNQNIDVNGNELQNVVSNSPGDAVNRTWVNNNDDTIKDNQTLQEVLEEGNSAGSYNIDMNGNNITNVDELNPSGTTLETGGTVDVGSGSVTSSQRMCVGDRCT